MNDKSLRIIVFGDICPIQNKNPFDLVLSDVDVVVGNLECALAINPTPIKKAGPVLSVPESFALSLKDFGFDAISLANNHIRDCGDRGVESTIDALSQNGIAVFGGGKDETTAGKPYIVEQNGLKVAFLSFAEKEFNYIHANKSGAISFDPFDSISSIRKVRNTVDALVVLFHGGIENYIYPSPLLQKKCRAMIDAGADVVLCQHSHCIGTRERYGDGEILYGQGNSVFGYREGNNAWNYGLLVDVSVEASRTFVRYDVLETAKDGSVHFAAEDKSRAIISRMDSESEKLFDMPFISQEWRAFCHKNEAIYLPMLLGFSKNGTRLNRFLKNRLVEIFYSRRQLNVAHNIIRCDAHREVIETILQEWEFD